MTAWSRHSVSNCTGKSFADGEAMLVFLRCAGEVREWLNRAVSKTVRSGNGPRGFESHPLRRAIARMAELADALHSGCSVRKDVQVRLLFRALVLVVAMLLPLQAQQVQRFPQAIISTSTARERADFFSRQGMWDSAEVYYQLWTQANPRDTTAWVALARLQARRGDLEAALAALAGAARAGMAHRALIESDSLLSPLLRTARGREIAVRMTTNAAEQAEYPARFARQQRIGRYRVLYPPGYDSLQRYPLVLLLHGNGNEPVMMLRWAKALGLQRAIIVCPEAPYVKVAETIAQGRLRLSAAGEDLAAPDTLNPMITDLSARWYVDVLDDAQQSLPIERSVLPVVVGFSQGGFYAQVLATRYPERVRAAVLLAPSYYHWGGIAQRLDNLVRYGIEVLHVHGRNDPIVPMQTAQLISELYRRAQVKYTLIEFDGEHWIPDDLARRIGEWIAQRLR